MGRFRKKPMEVEAFRWGPDEVPDWMPKPTVDMRQQVGVALSRALMLGEIWADADDLWIGTGRGAVRVRHGDWIVRTDGGSIFPMTAQAFAAKYEPID